MVSAERIPEQYHIMSVDLRHRNPRAVTERAHVGALHIGRCDTREVPLFITMAIVEQSDVREVYFKRDDLQSLSPYLKYYIHPWIPEADLFYVLESHTRTSPYYQDIFLLARAALTEAEERSAFRKHRKLIKQHIKQQQMTNNEMSDNES